MTPDQAVTDVRGAALRLLSSGLYVLATCQEETVHSATVTWVSQVSAEPPLVLVALRRNSRLAQAVRQAHRFALNILAADQESLAAQFLSHVTVPATSAELAGFAFRSGPGHCPLLLDAAAWLECRMAAELSSPGDHTLILGDVTGTGVRRQAQPMILGNTRWGYGGAAE